MQRPASAARRPEELSLPQLLRRSCTLELRGDWREEAEVVNARILKLNPRCVEAWTRLAEYELVQGSLELAETMLRRALMIDPDSWVARSLLDTTKRQQQLRESVAHVATFQEAFARGVFERRRGNGELALALLQKAHQMRPNDTACRIALAAAHRQLERPRVAADLHRTVLASGFNKAAQVGLAGALRDTVKLDEAEKLDREVLRRHPGDDFAHNGLMGILADKHQLASAELDRLLEEEPWFSDQPSELQQIHRRQSRSNGA